MQPVSAGEQEPLLEGQEAGNSVNATKEDVESGGHSPDAKVRGISQAWMVGWECLCPLLMSCVPSLPAALGLC